MFVVDTNILLDSVEPNSPFHSKCRHWISEQQSGASAWYITWPIVYEFLRVSTHPRVLKKPFSLEDAWVFLDALTTSPGLSVLVPTERHHSVAGQVFSELPELRGNIMHDTATAIVMREHGIRRIVTRDTNFHRFGFLEVWDPTFELD